MATWHDTTSLVEAWGAEADPIPDALLESLIDVARDQVIAYAPRLDDYTEIPERYRLGHFRQAQNLYKSTIVDASGGVGMGSDFVVTPHPLDWHVKNILRPRRGAPRVR